MLFHVSYIVMKLKKRKFVHLHFYNHRLEWWQIFFFFSWNLKCIAMDCGKHENI